jgi:transposase InsO family protein
MRENNLLAVRNLGRLHGSKAHDGTIMTAQVDEMWGTDMTARESKASVFLEVDHCSLECVDIHAAKYGTRFEALESIRQGVRHAVAEGLIQRHDNRSQYVCSVFQEKISFLGIQSSPSFVREPQGNGIAERFFRTLKENLLWIRRLDTVKELRLALLEFKDTTAGNGSLDATATRLLQRCGSSKSMPQT